MKADLFRKLIIFLIIGGVSVNAAEDDITLFVNGNVYTVARQLPHAEAIAVPLVTSVNVPSPLL